MTSGVIVVKYGGWGLLMFLEPLSKCSGGFPYILLITLHPVTFVPIDDSTLFHERIFVLGSHQEAFDGITSFEVYLHSIFLACSLEAFTQPFIIWYHYVRILFLVASHAAPVPLLVFMGWCFHSYLYPAECPNRVFTFSDAIYRRLYPTRASPPKFYGLPKVHMSGMPLRPIISSIGSVTYETSKELSRILKPLEGRSPHHVQNNQEFLKQLGDIKLGSDDIMSYDVKALLTSVPIKPALLIIQKLLEEDQTLPQRTTMTVNNITCPLEFCLTSTYFTFQEKFYEQVEGAAMGSPNSCIVANIYMEDFEMRALNTAPQPPLMRERYVDDTCVIIKAAQQQSFLNHINSIDKNIQFTSEEPRPDGSTPFLDILLIPGVDGSITTSVFRKPTHTDLYMQWDSHHAISSK